MPFFSSHAITARLASAVCMPSMTSPAPAFALFTARPSPLVAASPVHCVPSISTTCTTGSANSLANSKSRSSCAGTAMMAPVP